MQVLENDVGLSKLMLRYLKAVSATEQALPASAVSSIIGPDVLGNLQLVDSRYQIWHRFPATHLQAAIQFYQTRISGSSISELEMK